MVMEKHPIIKIRILLLEKLIPITITKLLDVGCGKGDIVNTLLKSHATFSPIGIELEVFSPPISSSSFYSSLAA